jgi:hypothetical protein
VRLRAVNSNGPGSRSVAIQSTPSNVNVALLTDGALGFYYPYENNYIEKEMWNYNKFFVNGDISNNIESIIFLVPESNYSVSTDVKKIGSSSLQNYRSVIQYAPITANVNQFTICFWVNTTGALNNQSDALRLLSVNTIGGTQGQERYSVFQAYGTSIGNAPSLGSYSNDSTFGGRYTQNKAWLGDWFHWAVVVNNGSTTHYYDGSSSGTVSYTTSNATGLSITIGSSENENKNGTYNSYIDDLRLYTRPLSEIEITSIFNYRGTL